MQKLKFLWLYGFLLLISFGLSAQSFTLTGKVTNTKGEPLYNASVWLVPSQKGVVTDADGHFTIKDLPQNTYKLTVSYMGYETVEKEFGLEKSMHMDIPLESAFQTLHEVTITHDLAHQKAVQDSRSMEFVSDEFIRRNISGSLMQSLERLPGVSAMSIGSGQSKPAIRGLGFNRVAVTENGIKHEGQQWGAEHGLEIDQFSTESIEVIKGPASLMHGSDAIGGVIEINSAAIPKKNSLGGNMQLLGKSNNESVAGSLLLQGRRDKFYTKVRATLVDYADFKVPTDKVYLYNWAVPLYKNRARNTAGKEHNAHLTLGYTVENFGTSFSMSSLNSKSGVFANAAGLHPLDADSELHDASNRDIQMPYQNVSHFKLANQSWWHVGIHELNLEAGYQSNFRQEWMTYSPENANMPNTFPDSLDFPSTLEKQFDKEVWSFNLRDKMEINERVNLTSGVNFQSQSNNIGGKGFLVPNFKSKSVGIFSIARYTLNEHSKFNAGLRFDYHTLETEDYFDWYEPHRQRAWALTRDFKNLSWSVGYNYNKDHLNIKANLGKSFRVPQAQELAANGINYHMFRVEKGDSSLMPEISYQLDAGLEWHSTVFAFGASPFINYFTNYIYLNPMGIDDDTYKQRYDYIEAEVLRGGGELHAHYQVLRNLKLGVIAELVYSVQLTGPKAGYNLPFAPPPSSIINATYQFTDHGPFSESFVSLDCRITAAQNNVVPPEESTPASGIFNIQSGTKLRYGKTPVELGFQVNNLLNTKYYNHSSYYRIINMPEPGRNFIVNIKVPFGT